VDERRPGANGGRLDERQRRRRAAAWRERGGIDERQQRRRAAAWTSGGRPGASGSGLDGRRGFFNFYIG